SSWPVCGTASAWGFQISTGGECSAGGFRQAQPPDTAEPPETAAGSIQPFMKSSVEPLEGNKVKLYVEVDEAEFDKDIDAAFKTIAREVKLPGFRNGKAPRRLLEARIGLAP